MKRILLIDDEDGIRTVWKTFHSVMEPTFRGQCDLETASDLATAEAMLAAQQYDAIILDLNLPPLTQDETITWIAENHDKQPPIIVITGDNDIYVRRRCMMFGAAQFWTKEDAHQWPNLFFKILYNEYLKKQYLNTADGPATTPDRPLV